MLIYNVSVKVDHDVEEEWLQWMKQTHVPDIMRTGMFIEARICKLDSAEEHDENTFIIQYSCDSREKLENYFENFAPLLREDFNRRYKDRTTLFRTVMEEIEKFKG